MPTQSITNKTNGAVWNPTVQCIESGVSDEERERETRVCARVRVSVCVI
jgi:hypothetical protein